MHAAPHIPQRPADGLPMPQRLGAILAVAFGVSLSVIDGTVANVALPTIGQQLGISAADSIWIVNAYQLAIMVSLLSLSALGDVVGYRKVYIGGLMLFTVASVGCSLSGSLQALVLARVMQGFGAAAITSVNTSLIRFIYPKARLGRGMGVNATVVATSSVAGPTLAAGILSAADWPWLFAVNVPIGLAALALSRRFLPENPVRVREHRFDWRDAVMNALTFGLMMASVEGFSHGLDPRVLSLGVAALIVVGFFFIRGQLREPYPILPFDLLRIPIFSVSVATSVCSFLGQMLAMVALPFYLQQACGYNDVETGLLLTAWPAVIMVVAPAAGLLVERIHAGLLGGTGLTMMAAGLFLLAFLPLGVAALIVVGFFFIRGQLREPYPILPFDLLRIPIFSVSVATSVCSFLGQMLAMVALPFYLQQACGYNDVETGLLLTAWPAVIMVVAPAAGLLVERIHAGLLGGTGLTMMAAGLFLLAFLPEHPTDFDIIWRLVLCGAGFGLFQSPNNSILIASAPPERSGSASGMLATARLAGQTTGAALMALLFHVVPENSTHTALLLAGGFAVAGAAVSLARIRLPLPEGLKRIKNEK